MDKNTRIFSVVAVLAAAVVIVVVVIVLRHRPSPKVIICDDGPRTLIDMDDFTTRYWAYSYTFKANIENRANLEGKVEPTQFEKLSEALQEAREFEKLLVASYDGCAITKKDFSRDTAKFEVLNGLLQQIDTLAKLASPTNSDKERLKDLINEYIKESQQVATKE